jgi:hypothetical protein
VNRIVRSWERVISDHGPWIWRISFLIVAHVDSIAAFSKQFPLLEYDGAMPQSTTRVENSSDV